MESDLLCEPKFKTAPWCSGQGKGPHKSMTGSGPVDGGSNPPGATTALFSALFKKNAGENRLISSFYVNPGLFLLIF